MQNTIVVACIVAQASWMSLRMPPEQAITQHTNVLITPSNLSTKPVDETRVGARHKQSFKKTREYAIRRMTTYTPTTRKTP